MRVLYDDDIFTMQRAGGISRYFAQLMREFLKSGEVDCVSGTVMSENIYLRPFLSPAAQRISSWQWRQLKHLRRSLNRRRTAALLKRQEFDVFHPTYFNTRWMGTITKPFVLTIFDMIPERFPQFFPGPPPVVEAKKTLALHAAHIITDSEFSKREILHFYDLPDDRMTVIHHGTPELLQSGEVPAARASAFDGAILFVGARNDYKNFARFLAAVAPLVSSGEAPSVACVGGGMWSEREKRLARQHGLDGRMTLHVGVSDAELHQAYSSAALFVFPSLSEGFGIPLLEAMSAGCPIVASDIPAFREVAGDAAIYCNALDSSSMREKVRSLLADTWSRTRQIELGRVRVQNFRLKQTAAATAEVYRRCLT